MYSNNYTCNQSHPVGLIHANLVWSGKRSWSGVGWRSLSGPGMVWYLKLWFRQVSPSPVSYGLVWFCLAMISPSLVCCFLVFRSQIWSSVV